ncbi:hypothetical protein M501DRAFT_925441 [Patellaria atrata CBS 101060]|uniref:RRM domain-containing protein n=1 Tax=Patellaria atrata CBS 101060 TaxID=1346257 RepID=A0A9P4VWX0_9PEZI|nr:hypothetical protein M501DRAFT_925441 [Patellaria atrata CBS 101060]
MSTTVHVSNISHETSEKQVYDFFRFCGKISSISVKPTSDASDATQSATVTFEKETAANTAILLDNTQLGPTQVHVSSASSIDDLGGSKGTEEHKDDDDVPQEVKPRSRILAEYLAHGYTISDKAIEKGIQLDQQHGISERFLNALKSFDNKYKATEKAQAADAKVGATDKGLAAWQGLSSYFEKALSTPTGQKLRQFYENTNKQVLDVHNEARHLADLKTCKKPGKKVEQVSGTDKTRCNCGSQASVCSCAPGKCACANCSKNDDELQPSYAAVAEKPSAA